MNNIRPEVELLEKNKPRQARAKRTYDNILNAAAELLVEVGVERISTNLVAERAGITVPALYRYFPNKYAVLYALGASLLDRHSAIIEHWFDRYFKQGGMLGLLQKTDDLFNGTYQVTKEQVGGYEITQALRAVQPLQELRLQSHRRVATQFCEVTTCALRRPIDDEMMIQARVAVGLFYDVVETALSDTDVPPERLLKHGARLFSTYWSEILNPAPREQHDWDAVPHVAPQGINTWDSM